ncbi:hypothetical protein ACFXPA_36630, partial [Amycolatopsis sp. NPDC059090]
MPGPVRIQIETGLGWTELAAGDRAQAAALFGRAASSGIGNGNLPSAAGAVEGLAALALAKGSAADAAAMLGVATVFRGTTDGGGGDAGGEWARRAPPPPGPRARSAGP